VSFLEIEQVLKLSELDHEKNRTQLLELRLCVDDQESHSSSSTIFGLHLAEFVAQISSFLKNEETQLLSLADQILDSKEQKRLLDGALKFEQAQGLEQLRDSRLIFNRLRTKRGMPAA
jgi:siderophore synthetase component